MRSNNVSINKNPMIQKQNYPVNINQRLQNQIKTLIFVIFVLTFQETLNDRVDV